MGKYRNKEWLEKKYIKEEKPGTEIAEICDVHSTTIYNWLKKFGIPINLRLNRIELTNDLCEFLDGLLLGDGCIYPKGRSAIYTHTEKHKEYLEWLSSKLESLGMEEVSLRLDSRGDFRYKSRAYVDLMEVRERWYPSGSKRIPSDVKITPTTLMNWYVGDGTFYRDDYEAILGVKNEKCRKRLPIVKSKLEEIGIHSTVNSTGLAIYKSDSLDRFFEYIGGAERPPCYNYKFPN